LQPERAGNDTRGVAELVDAIAQITTDEAIEPGLHAFGTESAPLGGVTSALAQILEQRARLARDVDIAAQRRNANI
jgi:hypothetical protein